jgi:ferrous iron transport protein A
MIHRPFQNRRSAPPPTPGAHGTVVPLSRVPRGASAIVHAVRTGTSDAEGGDLGLRLLELGFVEGERIRVIAQGFPGGEPIAVRVGGTTFALRRFEAEHVLVEATQPESAR